MSKSGHSASRACPPGCVDERLTTRVLAAATDLALVVDPDGEIEDVVVGQGADPKAAWKKLLGKRWVDTIAIDSRTKGELLLKEAREADAVRSREINQQVEGLGEVAFRYSALLLDPKQQKVVVLGRDLRAISGLQQQMISAQQAMDREYSKLRQSETRYRLLFQVASEGVLVVDTANLAVIEANPAASSLLEEPASVLQNKPLEELFQARSWTAVKTLLSAVESGGKPTDLNAQLLSRRRAVTVSASLFRQSGSPLLLLRLRPTDGLPAPDGGRGSRMLAALDALPDGFVVIGEDHRILSANPAFCDLVQQANENLVVGQALDRWLGRPGVDLNIMLANLREHGSVRNFSTIVHADYGAPQEAVVSAVVALDAKLPCIGFAIRPVSAWISAPATGSVPMPRSVDQLRELVGRVSLQEIVRESTDLIERLCIEAALKVSGDNRASAAQLLGLSRQGLYSKLKRHGLRDLDPSELA